MLDAGKAEAVVVVKLDRPTRTVKDLGVLTENYFGDGKPWSLLAVSDSIDHSLSGGESGAERTDVGGAVGTGGDL